MSVTIPETDILGQPTAPYTRTRAEWAVVVDGSFKGNAGPHLLDPRPEAEARKQLRSWREDRPTANARLVRREIVETAGEWEEA